MIKIDKELIDKLSLEATKSSRLRMNYNFHTNAEDPLNRMLNALCKDTYIRPHKHQTPDKREVFLILVGRLLLVEFDEKGTITNHHILDSSKGNYGAEILPRTFHTLISLSESSVIYEIKDGPYNAKNDKFFAAWAPEEGSLDAVEYNNTILKKLKLE